MVCNRCQVFLFVFSLSVSAIHLSFKENDSVVLQKELGQCAVFENNRIGFHDLKGNPVILCLFFFVSPGCFEQFSNLIRSGLCICFQLWLNADGRVTSVLSAMQPALNAAQRQHADHLTLYSRRLDWLEFKCRCSYIHYVDSTMLCRLHVPAEERNLHWPSTSVTHQRC